MVLVVVVPWPLLGQFCSLRFISFLLPLSKCWLLSNSCGRSLFVQQSKEEKKEGEEEEEAKPAVVFLPSFTLNILEAALSLQSCQIYGLSNRASGLGHRKSGIWIFQKTFLRFFIYLFIYLKKEDGEEKFFHASLNQSVLNTFCCKMLLPRWPPPPPPHLIFKPVNLSYRWMQQILRVVSMS